MKSSHRFPLRRQIVWGMRFFTILTSLAVGAALFTLSNQYVRANTLQAATCGWWLPPSRPVWTAPMLF